jgi:hypothetical protein
MDNSIPNHAIRDNITKIQIFINEIKKIKNIPTEIETIDLSEFLKTNGEKYNEEVIAEYSTISIHDKNKIYSFFREYIKHNDFNINSNTSSGNYAITLTNTNLYSENIKQGEPGEIKINYKADKPLRELCSMLVNITETPPVKKRLDILTNDVIINRINEKLLNIMADYLQILHNLFEIDKRTLDKELNDITSELEQAKNENTQMEEKIKSVTEDISKKEQQIGSNKVELETAKHLLETLKQEKTKTDLLISALEKEKIDIKKVLLNKETELAEINETLRFYEAAETQISNATNMPLTTTTKKYFKYLVKLTNLLD